MTEPEAIADTGPLIHLDEVGMADALHIFRRIVVPYAVVDELRLQPRGPGGRLLRKPHVHPTRPSPDEHAAAQALPFRRLTAADREALTMAHARDRPLLTDDLDLRAAAKALEVQPLGTVGLIVLAALTDIVPKDDARRGLDDLLASSSLFVTKALTEEAKAALDR